MENVLAATKTSKSKIWLVGDPAFSLAYYNSEGITVYTDLVGYRPDPCDYLRSKRVYNAVLEFKNEAGKYALRAIEANGARLVYLF
jgi:hypothetical protein